MTITISGSGTITGVSAGGLPSGTVTQATLATPVAGTGPAFSVYLSAIQNVTSNVPTKIAFNSETFDTASAFDSTTNYRFTPQVAGYYQFNAVLNPNGTTITALSINIYKNGSLYTRIGYQASSAPASGSCLVYLNGSTDYIELYGLVIAASGAGFYSDGTQAYTSFQGSLVRSA